MGSQRVRHNWVAELNWTEGCRNLLEPKTCPLGFIHVIIIFFFSQQTFLRIFLKKKGSIGAIPDMSLQSEATNIWKVYNCKCFECWTKSLQLCLTLCNPVDCTLPGSSVHGILQARILEWIAISFSRGSSWPKRDKALVTCIGRWILYYLSYQSGRLCIVYTYSVSIQIWLRS